MRDPRINSLARQVIDYSVHLQQGEKILIDVWDGAEDFAIALMEQAQRVGGQPYVNLQSMAVERAFMLGLDEPTIKGWYEYELNRMKEMDAYVVVAVRRISMNMRMCRRKRKICTISITGFFTTASGSPIPNGVCFAIRMPLWRSSPA